MLTGSLALVVGVAGTLLLVVLLQERAAARGVARAELAEVSRRVVYRVEQLLGAAEMTATSAARSFGGGARPAREWEDAFIRLVPAFEQRPELTYLGFSLAQTGEAAFLHRLPDGLLQWLAYVDTPAGSRVIRVYDYRAGAFHLREEKPWDGYDPRRRPFFQRAAASRKPDWVGTYPFTDPGGRNPIAGVTYCLPVFNPAGELAGVWDADFDQAALCQFMRQLRHETHAESFIVETRPGNLQAIVAHPDEHRLSRGDEPARTTAAWLAAEAPFLLPGTRYSTEAAELRVPNLRWTLCTALPRSGATSAFLHQQSWLILLVTCGAIAVAVGGSIAFARLTASPVEELRAAVAGLAAGAAPELRNRPAPRELLELNAAFGEMAAAIATRQQQLAAANVTLQREVAQRTGQEAQLAAVISHVPFELLVWAADGRCILQNAASAQRLGPLVGATLDAPPSPKLARLQLAENVRQALAGHVVHRNLVGSDEGVLVFTNAVFAPVRAEGRITGVVCVNIDVSEQRRAEEALRSSQRRLSLHLENTPLGVIDWTPDLLVAAWNPAAELIFGWPAAEALGRELSFLIPTSERPPVTTSWRNLLARRGSARYSHPSVTRDGRTIECDWYATVVTDADDRVASISTLVLDVTERASAERLFRESDERFQKAFRRAPTPQAIVRLVNNALVDVNDRWVQSFGLTREAVVGRTALEIGLWPDAATRSEVLRELDRNGEIHDREIQLRRADERTGVFLLSVTLVNLAGEATMLFSFIDITERQRAEHEVRLLNESLEHRVADRTRELEQANAKLQELDRLKSEFLATMSHELRTPLNSIIGFSAILRQGMAGPLNTEQLKQIEMVHGSARHLLGLINDLLDVSRIEAGRIELFPEAVALPAVLEDVERTLAPLVATKHLRYATECAAGLPAIVSDRKRLYQIVLNLANNAVKFTERGEVVVRAVATPEGGVAIAVRDTGIGIRAENLPRLFEAFRQVDGSARRVYEGTGLGLFLVRKLLLLLGGGVTVASEFGKGSTFTITLPAQGPAAPRGADAPPSVWSARPPKP
ncbi:MAG: PAS domain S-box protein [Opitutaceae bacterium]